MKVPEFYSGYVALADHKDLLSSYKKETEEALKFYRLISDKKSLHRYEITKWSIKEVLGHICDAEQIFFFRLLSIMRNEKKSLPGFDENEYVKAANFNSVPWEHILNRFEQSRKFFHILIQELSIEDLGKVGNTNGFDISIEALIAIIIGHEKHHRKIIKERYLD